VPVNASAAEIAESTGSPVSPGVSPVSKSTILESEVKTCTSGVKSGVTVKMFRGPLLEAGKAEPGVKVGSTGAKSATTAKTVATTKTNVMRI